MTTQETPKDVMVNDLNAGVTKVNVGKRTKAQDKVALEAAVSPDNIPSGSTLEVTDEGTFIVTQLAFGQSIRTRIA